MRHHGDMPADPAQVAHRVQQQPGGASPSPGRQPPGRLAFRDAQPFLAADQLPRRLGVLQHEDGDRQAKLLLQRRVQRGDLLQPGLLQRDAAPQPLAGMAQQVALHHVGRVFQRDGEGLHLLQPADLLLAQRVARDRER